MLNCTPHPVVIYSYSPDPATPRKILLTIPPSGNVIRIKTPPQTPLGHLRVDGVDVPIVAAQDFNDGEVIGLPRGPGDDSSEEEWTGRQWESWAIDTPIIVGVVGAEAVDLAWPGPVYVTDTGPDSVVRATTDDVVAGRAIKVGDILGIRRLARLRSPT